MQTKRIIITGVGVVSPFGTGKEAFINGIETGLYCAQAITRFATGAVRSKEACLIRDENLGDIDPRLARLPAVYRYGLVAAEEALNDSVINLREEEKDRLGIFYGTACNTEQSVQYHLTLTERGPNSVSPLMFQNTTYMAGPGIISIRNGITGPAIAIPGGYSAGLQALDIAVSYLLSGYIDRALIVGAEEVTRLQHEALSSLKLLSPTRNDTEEISRPFDADRDGMVLGEGAGALMLEVSGNAKEPGKKVYAELVGIGITHDAYRTADVSPDGRGLEHSMRAALTNADEDPQSVDYIAAAANSTRIFDNAEVAAIQKLFGLGNKTPVSSIKSMIGETSAAGAIFNVVAAVFAIANSFLPPTINYKNHDPECDVDCVPNTARPQVVKFALANACSFGGSCGTVALKAFA